MSRNFITDEVKAAIGAETERERAFHVVEASEVRRFFQATMDSAPRYWNAESEEATRLGGIVAPLAFPTHAFRCGPEEVDPLETIGTENLDGASRSFHGLPSVNIPLPRLLNGGFEYEFFRYARVGELIFRKSRLKDILQKENKGAPMVLVFVETEYSVENGELLLRVSNTIILR